jgi:hypothetical protein
MVVVTAEIHGLAGCLFKPTMTARRGIRTLCAEQWIAISRRVLNISDAQTD